MTLTDEYKTWEVGKQDTPPPALVRALQSSEHLLWAAEVPVSRFLTRRVFGVLFFAVLAFLFSQSAPWEQSVAEYCADNRSQRCRVLYVIIWPGVILFAGLSIYALQMLWKAKRSPWHDSFGITSRHAILINGNAPDKLHRQKLDRNKAWICAFRDVRFMKSPVWFRFTTLNLSDAKRAVYWANEGRLQPEFQNGPTT